LGVDFTAILDHALTWEEVCRLPAILNSNWTPPSVLARFLLNYPRAGRDWRWRLSPTFNSPAEELFDEGHLLLEGPSCFAMQVFKRACEVTSPARWWSFLFEADVRAGLLEGIQGLAKVLRSSTIVYLPDSAYPPSLASDLVYEGRGVADVVTWLETNVGAPAPSIDGICGADEENWNESGYVVERLEP
jgi:hypothetical protein